VPQAVPDNDDGNVPLRSGRQRQSQEWLLVLLAAVALTGCTAVLASGRFAIEDALYDDGFDFANSGDVLGGALWALALWFCSPWQLLLLFLGKIETGRPSEWLLKALGTATGQRCVAPLKCLPACLSVCLPACIATNRADPWHCDGAAALHPAPLPQVSVCLHSDQLTTLKQMSRHALQRYSEGAS
jgi:hypothetical protein